MVDPSQNIHEFVRYGYVLVLATGSTPISLAFPSKEGRNKEEKFRRTNIPRDKPAIGNYATFVPRKAHRLVSLHGVMMRGPGKKVHFKLSTKRSL